MERIDRIEPRRGGIVPVTAALPVDRREPDQDRREQERRRRKRPSEPPRPPVEPGHIDVTA